MNIAAGSIVINPAVNMNAEKMSDEQIKMFEDVFRDIDGAGYFPLLFIGSQIVAGQLHYFIAQRNFMNGQGVQTSLLKIVIYQNLNNEFAIHSISEI